MKNPARNEQRTQPRKRRSDAIAWRLNRADSPRGAWLLDSSEDGMAFAWRGGPVPAVDSLIEVIADPDGRPQDIRIARVRRVSVVHDDLMVLGAEVWRTNPFPPAAEGVEAKTPTLLSANHRKTLDLTPFDPDAVMARAAELRKTAWWRSGG